MFKSSDSMNRYFLRFSYIGTCYRGSQKHVNSNVLDVDSIQGAIESSIMKVFPNLSHLPHLILAGRTDAGVHAMCAAAHVDLDYEFKNHFDTTDFVKLMNRYCYRCGHDIRILSCQKVSKDFHARYSAKSRKYLYRFLLAKNPNDHKIPIAEMYRTLHLHSNKDKFDIEKLKEGLELFQGTKDFTTFSAKSNSREKLDDDFKRRYVRTLQVTLEKGEPLMSFDPFSNNFDYWNITFTSKAFLYNQIRRIVGALVALGQNKLSKEDIITMLQVPSHQNWNTRGSIAPSHGLYLMNVDYDQEIN